MKKKILFSFIILITIITLTFGLQNNATDSAASNEITKTVTTKKIEKLNKKLENLINDQGTTNIDVAIKYKGKTIQVTNNKTAEYSDASSIKVAIAVQLLHEIKNPERLTTVQTKELKQMITKSDNEAATDLLVNSLGSKTALQKIISDLNLENTEINNSWGLTDISAKDQLKILDQIFNNGNYLTDSSKKYLQKLMNQIDSNQNWGISAGSDINNVSLKNGWLNMNSSYDPNGGSLDAETWVVNSIGQVRMDNSDYTIAIMTNNNVSERTGIELVEKISSVVHECLK